MTLRLRDVLILWAALMATAYAVSRYTAQLCNCRKPITLEEVNYEYRQTHAGRSTDNGR